MKRISVILTAIICAVAVMFALVGCAAPGAPTHDTSAPTYVIDEAKMSATLDEFMTGREDRTTYTDAEKRAADYLNDKLVSFGYTDTEIREFDYINNNSTKVTSQNVIAVYKAAQNSETAKTVIIGAYYDNRYTSPFLDEGSGTRSHGALSNGTGVATLLAIAEYLQTAKPALPFNVMTVFFGASSVSTYGASQFVSKMDASARDNVVLMIELQRIGCDHIYAFSDARETARESLIDRVSAENSLDIYKPTQKSPEITSVYSLYGVPYFQWVHSGIFQPFFNVNIPTLNIIGGNWETIDLTDCESASHPNVSYTQNDTLATLKSYYPDYAKKMSSAATLVVKTLTDAEFLSTVQYDHDNFPNTSILMKRWVFYLIALAIVGVAALIMTAVNSHLSKKYAIKPVEPKNIKMAVFGMDYEDKNSDDIFIDIKQAAPDEIFPGVPNNTGSAPVTANPVMPPVIITQEPAKPETETKPEAEVKTEDEKPEAEVKTEAETKSETATKPEERKPETEVKPVEEAKPEAETKPEEEAKPKAASKPKTSSNPKTASSAKGNGSSSGGAGTKQPAAKKTSTKKPIASDSAKTTAGKKPAAKKPLEKVEKVDKNEKGEE